MRTTLRGVLDISEAEERPVYFLLLNSFFLGLFLATFDVTASTLFIDTFSEKRLPEGFITSGVLGVIFTSAFGFLQTRIAFSRLAIYNQIFIFLVTVLLAVSLELNQKNENLIFLAFGLMLPLNTLALLGFYGTVSRSFNLKDEKRITGTVDQGQMIALTIAFFLIPFIQNIITDLAAYLFISGASVLIVLLFQAMFYGSVSGADRLFKSGTSKSTRPQVITYGQLFGERYMRLLVAFAVLSAAAVLVVEYNFLSVAAQQYPDTNSLANFLAYYGGILTIFSLVLQTFVADRVIASYGMKISLLILPLVVGIIALISSVIGLFFGASSSFEGFIFFFLFVAMTKLLHNATFDAFEDPISKTLLIPLDADIKLDAQSKINGFFREMAKIVVGAILIGLGLLQFASQALFTFILAVAMLYYGFLLIVIYSEYRKTLTNTLSKHKTEDDADLNMEYDLTGLLKKNIRTSDLKKLGSGLRLLKKLNPLEYQFSLGLLLSNKTDSIRSLATNSITPFDFMIDQDLVKNRLNAENSTKIKKEIEEKLHELESTKFSVGSLNELSQSLKSRNYSDRLKAIALVPQFKGEELRPFFNPLLRDPNSAVRQAALLMTTRLDDPYYYPLITENLANPEFSAAAASALVLAGNEAIPLLEGAFYRSGQSTGTMTLILQIYGRIATDKAIHAIWNKIDYPDAQIVSQVLYSLSTCGFMTTTENVARIRQTLEIEIGKVAWNIAAMEEFGDDNTEMLKEAMEEEIAADYQKIYMLLSLMYDPQSVQMVRSSVDSGTVEGLVYAIELLDVFLSDDIKPLLFPLLEDIPQSVRNEKLQTHYPREDLTEDEVLVYIINRDYNYLNKYTKACALYVMASRQRPMPAQDVMANLFNPDPFLRELATYLLLRGHREELVDCLQRLPDELQSELEAKLDYLDRTDIPLEQQELLINKIYRFKKLELFKELPGDLIMELFKSMQLFSSERSLLDEAPDYSFLTKGWVLLVEKGELKVITKSGNKEIMQANDTRSFSFLTDNDDPVVEILPQDQTLFYGLSEDKFLEVIASHTDMAKVLIAFIDKAQIQLEPKQA